MGIRDGKAPSALSGRAGGLFGTVCRPPVDQGTGTDAAASSPACPESAGAPAPPPPGGLIGRPLVDGPSPLNEGSAGTLTAPHPGGSRGAKLISGMAALWIAGVGIILLAIHGLALAVRVRLLEIEIKHLREKGTVPRRNGGQQL